MRQQIPQGYVILALVVLVVIAGVVFSAYQLWTSVRVAGPQMTSELELSAKNVRVTSSIVGIVVLVISIAFLLVYTRDIYALTPVDYIAK